MFWGAFNASADDLEWKLRGFGAFNLPGQTTISHQHATGEVVGSESFRDVGLGLGGSVEAVASFDPHLWFGLGVSGTGWDPVSASLYAVGQFIIPWNDLQWYFVGRAGYGTYDTLAMSSTDFQAQPNWDLGLGVEIPLGRILHSNWGFLVEGGYASNGGLSTSVVSVDSTSAYQLERYQRWHLNLGLTFQP